MRRSTVGAAGLNIKEWEPTGQQVDVFRLSQIRQFRCKWVLGLTGGTLRLQLPPRHSPFKLAFMQMPLVFGSTGLNRTKLTCPGWCWCCWFCRHRWRSWSRSRSRARFAKSRHPEKNPPQTRWVRKPPNSEPKTAFCYLLFVVVTGHVQNKKAVAERADRDAWEQSKSKVLFESQQLEVQSKTCRRFFATWGSRTTFSTQREREWLRGCDDNKHFKITH